MRIWLFHFVILMINAQSVQLFACSPVANFHPPKLRDNFQNSQIVVFGFVEKNETLKEGGFKIQLRAEKVWKGKVANTLVVTAGPGSTCDGFGLTAIEKSGCLLFLDASQKVLSGVYSGESSFCLPKDSPKLKTLVAKYDLRFKAHDDKSDCAAQGGRWEGTESGRGRLTGCNFPLLDSR